MRTNQPVTQQRVPLRSNANILSVTDPKGKIEHINQEFLEVSGFTADELLGQPHNLIRHPDMPRTAFQSFWASLKRGESWMGLVKNRCKNGDHYWVHAYVTPIVNAEGELVELQSVRQEPDEEAVQRASTLYRQLRTEEPDKGSVSLPNRPRWRLTLRVRTWLVFVGAMVPVMLAVLSSGLGWQAIAPVLSVLLFAAGAHFALKPLDRIMAAARNTIDDPIAEAVYFGKHDEEAGVGVALLKLRTELTAVSKRLYDTLEAARDKAEANSAAIREGHARAGHQTSETQQVAAAMEEMSQAVQQVASNASDGAEMVATVTKQTESGMQTVERSSQAVRELTSRVEGASAVINELVAETQRIETALELIQGITSQTNLLALNAAIEAARAGDRGRGFSVVAEEVRTLAIRTSESTSEIQEIVKSIREGSGRAVAAMEQSHDVASDTLSHSEESHEALRKISEGVASIADFTHQIASATEEQSVTAEEVNKNISNIDQLANEVQENIEIATEKTQSVIDEISRVSSLTGKFAGYS